MNEACNPPPILELIIYDAAMMAFGKNTVYGMLSPFTDLTASEVFLKQGIIPPVIAGDFHTASG
jgi:hypothetical protein